MKKLEMKGFSLVEMLVVLLIFSIVSILSTQALVNSLRSTRKSSNVGEVKENLEFSLSTMERLLRNAQEITCLSSTELEYLDGRNNLTNFTCISIAGKGRIASGSALLTLTSERVNMNDNCLTPVFTCTAASGSTPPSVEIFLEGREVQAKGAEAAVATARTKILLRSY